MTQKSRLVSGRVPVTSPATVSSDRYQWLALDQAEPNLGTAANNAVLSTNTLGTRTWTLSPTHTSLNITNSANIAGITANAVGIFWPNGIAYSSGITYSNSNVQVLLSAFAGNLNVSGYINVIGTIFGDVITANTRVNSLGDMMTANGVFWSNGAPYYSDANVRTVISNYGGNISAYVGANQPYIQYLSGVGNISIANTVVMGPNATIQFANGTPYLYSNIALQSSLSSYGAPIVKAGNIFGNTVTGGTIIANTSVTAGTGFFWANGVAYGTSFQSVFGNANVGAYLTQNTGNIGGTLSTANQPYVQSVGALTGLTVNGGTTLTGLTVNGTTSINGNLVVPTTSFLKGDTVVTGNFRVDGATTTLNTPTLNTTASNITLATGAASKLNANGAGISFGPSGSFGYLRYDDAGGLGSGSLDTNLGIQPYWTGNLNLGGPGNYWGNVYATGIVTGSINTFASQAYFNTFFSTTINAGTVQASLIGNVGTTLIGAISTAAQTGITSVGTLTGLSVGGNATVSGTFFAANLQATTVGNSATTYNGSQLNVASAYIPTVNATYANITTANLGALTGALNVQGVTSLYANLLAASGVASQNTTSGAIVVSGTGGVGVGGNINAGGNVVAGGHVGPMYGTIQTNAQPYITSVGVLTDLTIAGNLTVQGNNTIIGSRDLTVNDSVINLHTFANLAPWTSNDGRDVGFKLHYYDSVLTTGDNLAFLGRANDSGFLEFYNTGYENPSNVFVGNTYGTIKSGEFFAANTTAATSSGTGALRVAGGAGISGQIYSAGINSTTGNLVTAYIGTLNASQINGATIGNVNAAINGGLATFANITTTNGIFWPNGLSYGQGTFSQFSTANIDQYLPGYQGNLSSSYTTVNQDLLVRGTANLAYLTIIGNGTTSTSKTTGALRVNGGVGITGDVNIGTSLTVDGGAYGNVVTTQFGSVFATAYGPNGYSIIQAWSSTTGGALGLNAYGNIVYSAGAINFRTGATIRDKDYPTGGTTGVQIASNGAIIASTGIASTTTGTGALIVTGGASLSGNVYAGAYYSNGYYWAANGASILTGLSGGGGGGSGTSGAYYSGYTNFSGSPITDLGASESYVFSAGVPYSDSFGQTLSTYTSDWNELETALNTLDLGTLP